MCPCSTHVTATLYWQWQQLWGPDGAFLRQLRRALQRQTFERGQHCICRIPGCGLLFLGLFMAPRSFEETLCGTAGPFLQQDPGALQSRRFAGNWTALLFKKLVSSAVSYLWESVEKRRRFAGTVVTASESSACFVAKNIRTRGHQGQNRPPKLGCFFKGNSC